VTGGGANDRGRDLPFCLGEAPQSCGCNPATLLGDVGMNAEEKIALDLVLVLLICVLVWMRWHRE
jgi:hypothetical protein